MFGKKRKLAGGIISITYKKCTVAALVLAVVFCTVFGTVYVKGGTPVAAVGGKDWGISFGTAGEQPRGNATVEELINLDTYYMGKSDQKVIYLTYDSGYENGNTAAILDALKWHKAPATFFVVGHYLRSAADLVERMAREGHVVANHTYHHPDMSAISDNAKFSEELQSLEQEYKALTGKEMVKYYRPPQGKYSLTNLQAAKELGYKTFFWSLAYVDWNDKAQPSEEEALEKLTSRIHPGAVLLLHNTSSTNAAVLDRLLTEYEKMGYTVKPLSHLINAYINKNQG